MTRPDRLEAHLALAESLGATVARLSGDEVAEGVLQYARKHNVTRIIVGKPTHSRFRDRLRGSLVDDIVRGSGAIDVHVTGGDAAGDISRAPSQPVDRPPRVPVTRYVSAALLVAATLGIAALLRHMLALPDLEMLFLLAVMIAAVWFGRGPSVLAAALGTAAYDFFFVPPLYTFSVSDRRYFLTFAMMFGVSFAMSALAGRLRRQERDAVAREERTGVLFALIARACIDR